MISCLLVMFPGSKSLLQILAFMVCFCTIHVVVQLLLKPVEKLDRGVRKYKANIKVSSLVDSYTILEQGTPDRVPDVAGASDLNACVGRVREVLVTAFVLSAVSCVLIF